MYSGMLISYEPRVRRLMNRILFYIFKVNLILKDFKTTSNAVVVSYYVTRDLGQMKYVMASNIERSAQFLAQLKLILSLKYANSLCISKNRLS